MGMHDVFALSFPGTVTQAGYASTGRNQLEISLTSLKFFCSSVVLIHPSHMRLLASASDVTQRGVGAENDRSVQRVILSPLILLSPQGIADGVDQLRTPTCHGKSIGDFGSTTIASRQLARTLRLTFEAGRPRAWIFAHYHWVSTREGSTPIM
jgi:hypothetical protein